MTRGLFLLFIFLILYCIFGILAKKKREGIAFLHNYFLANCGINFFLMALVIASSYISASSFISGPSAVYNYGMSFILLAVIQIPAGIISFTIVGERLNTEARKINAINIVDYIRYRYASNSLALVSSFIIIFFSLFLISAQLIGGAKLLEFFLKLDYRDSLIFFSLFVFLYVCLGGFKVVAYTDLIQGIFMIVASMILFLRLVNLGGGIDNIFKESILKLGSDLLAPSNSDLQIEYIISFWILTGVGTLGLPQLVNNFIAFKNDRDIRRALPVATFLIGFLVIVMHLIGFFSLVIFPNFKPNDKVIIRVASEVLGPRLFFLFFIGLLSAIMSTIDTGFLFISSIWVKTVMSLNKKIVDKDRINVVTVISNAFFVVVIVLFSLRPPDFLLFVNIFAIGALEVAFFSTIVFGLYFKFVSKASAFVSQFLGLLSYLIIIFCKMDSYSFHPVVPSLFISVLSFLIVNLVCSRYNNI
ncbi:sodium/pantothenate symporter [Borrelia sp. RT1S]|uniref:sodium/pantothenate symporter n=1 Tax=Borrelia sp. RT1S TaxID=2898580 RepID=UPI001E34B33C|nr:sodium/pantothenate symporter [Borrelia sp. RT1S]UGQ17586.1 sodium/pantothenate symporter [Borrelia sp. RT1S]